MSQPFLSSLMYLWPLVQLTVSCGAVAAIYDDFDQKVSA
jgi:hypothetical protein